MPDIAKQFLLCDAGVINHHVDMPKAFQCLRRRSDCLRFGRQVSAKERRVAAGGGQLVQE